MNDSLRFASACNGLVATVRDAANPAYPVWVPYRGNMIEVAVWWARRVAHMGRHVYRPYQPCPDCGAGPDDVCAPECGCACCRRRDHLAAVRSELER